jgi:predicted  nucleic acid-binding Zn-ribbon protein
MAVGNGLFSQWFFFSVTENERVEIDKLQKALDKVVTQLSHYRKDAEIKQVELKRLKAELKLLTDRNT